MAGLLSFLSGGAFRALFGEVSTWLTKRQDHKYELQRMTLQNTLDAATHERNLAAQRQQAELGYKTINVQADADERRLEAQAWADATSRAQAPTGVRWIDAASALVRPAYAYWSLGLWGLYEIRHMALTGWVISAFSLEIISAIIGFFFVNRHLAKSGK